MKILHVITSLGTGGAERLLVDLLPRLRDFGNEVELLVFNGKNTPFMNGCWHHHLHTGHTRKRLPSHIPVETMAIPA